MKKLFWIDFKCPFEQLINLQAGELVNLQTCELVNL